jgi:hypothetical protein
MSQVRLPTRLATVTLIEYLYPSYVHNITQHRQYRWRDPPTAGGGVIGAKYA